jgi:hypothetical protein
MDERVQRSRQVVVGTTSQQSQSPPPQGMIFVSPPRFVGKGEVYMSMYRHIHTVGHDP